VLRYWNDYTSVENAGKEIINKQALTEFQKNDNRER
jgi:hypothetical protein